MPLPVEGGADDLALLQQHFADRLIGTEVFRGQAQADVRAGGILDVLRLLKEAAGYGFLSDLTAADYLRFDDKPERFAVIYNLYALGDRKRMIVRGWIAGDPPTIDTATALWPGADWLEREVWDLYGIRFRGHPDLKRLLCPEEFIHHPLRKDYPLEGRGERESFRRVPR
jgi:NADH-quinone oxidoreductase subunit C